MPQPSRFENSPAFLRLLDGDEVGWELLALELGRDVQPGLDPAPYLNRLDDLAHRVRTRCQPNTRSRDVIGQLNWVLFVEERFRGDEEHYDDPRNSYLHEVMDRRLGIPITLSVLYRAVAQRTGLPMAGVNLPGHFVLKAGSGQDALFVDAYHQGVVLDRAGCERRVEEVTGRRVKLSDRLLAPCSTVAMIARMLGNLKRIHLRESDFAAALPVQRRRAALLASDLFEARDLGVIALHAGFPGEAIDPLDRFLRSCPDDEDSEAITALLRLARYEVSGWN